MSHNGMTSRNDIDHAIRNRDGITLRKTAERAQKQETRMFLNLLADFVERDLVERDLKESKKTAA